VTKDELQELVKKIARTEALKLWRRERNRVRRKQRELHDDDELDELDQEGL
jgi:hypothetical protein